MNIKRHTWPGIGIINSKRIHVRSPGLGGKLPHFDLISVLNINIPPKIGKLPLFWPYLLPFIFPIKRVNSIEFSN